MDDPREFLEEAAAEETAEAPADEAAEDTVEA